MRAEFMMQNPAPLPASLDAPSVATEPDLEPSLNDRPSMILEELPSHRSSEPDLEPSSVFVDVPVSVGPQRQELVGNGLASVLSARCEGTPDVEAQPGNNSCETANMSEAQAYGTREGEEAGEECTICFEQIQQGQLVTYLYCKHVFHSDCLHRWFETKIRHGQFGCCPNCNLRIVAPAPVQPVKEAEQEESAGTGRSSTCILPAFQICGIQFGNNRKTYLLIATLWLMVMFLVGLLRMGVF
mmetsp:Transcript_49982/g.100332  ORF Transcript_49982/g.100332 Transcript_49982/m.100332 type:complete len:242 (+) Transcript_49982:74-799(+)